MRPSKIAWKKNVGASSAQSRERDSHGHRRSPTCSVLNVSLLLIIVMMGGTIYTFETSRWSNTTTNQGKSMMLESGPGHGGLIKKYEAVMARAVAFAARYKNTTSSEPPFSNSTLRGSIVLPDTADSSAAVRRQKVNIVVRMASSTLRGSIVVPDLANSSAPVPRLKINVVVGMAQNTDPKNLVVFCNSLQKVAPAVEALIFVNAPIPARHKEIATMSGVRLVEFDVASLPPEFRCPNTPYFPVVRLAPLLALNQAFISPLPHT
jgi:hypothetical protein